MIKNINICLGYGEFKHKHKCWCDVNCAYCNKKLYKCSGDSEDGICPNKKRYDKLIAFS